jgi:hypothetical protein
MQKQIDTERMQFRQEPYEVLEREPPSGGKSSHPARCGPSPAYECVNSNCVGRNVPSSWRQITAIGAKN